MSRYWSPIVHQLTPYIPGEQPQDQAYIKLNTNENPYPPSPRVIEAISALDGDRLRRYPDPESSALSQALADYFSVEASNVFIGNGSDEVLAHSFQAFFNNGRPLLFPDISYSFYPVYCCLYQIEYRSIPLQVDFSLAIDDFSAGNGGIIFPNPNAPTSRLLPLQDIEALCHRHESSLIIVDEAYIDFGGESAIPLTRHYDNLLVIQTFSKSRSLAGLRLGYAIGQRHLIDGLKRVKDSFNSYPIDSIAQSAAIAALDDDDYFRDCCNRIISCRSSLTAALGTLGFDILPSAANFLFVRHPTARAAALYRQLKEQGILVRHFSKPRIADYLRITIGTDEQCTLLIEKLAGILGKAQRPVPS